MTAAGAKPAIKCLPQLTFLHIVKILRLWWQLQPKQPFQNLMGSKKGHQAPWHPGAPCWRPLIYRNKGNVEKCRFIPPCIKLVWERLLDSATIGAFQLVEFIIPTASTVLHFLYPLVCWLRRYSPCPLHWICSIVPIPTARYSDWFNGLLFLSKKFFSASLFRQNDLHESHECAKQP